MKLERYFSESWEWACCGGPLRVGDDAELKVQIDSEYAQTMRSELAAALPEGLTGVETHHDDNPVLQRGRIVALEAVIADTKWIVTPRVVPDRPMLALGGGVFAGAGNNASGQAEGVPVEGTSRIVPISVIPDATARPDDTGPDLATFGEQIRPGLSGYVITIQVP